jgi:hypothetical protein
MLVLLSILIDRADVIVTMMPFSGRKEYLSDTGISFENTRTGPIESKVLEYELVNDIEKTTVSSLRLSHINPRLLAVTTTTQLVAFFFR